MDKLNNNRFNRATPELDAPITEEFIWDKVHEPDEEYVPQLVRGNLNGEVKYYWDDSYRQDSNGYPIWGMELNGPEHNIYFRKKG